MAAKLGFGAGLAAGLGVGVVVLCLGSVAVFSFTEKQKAKARVGWNLVPVVVAAVDLAAGEVITMERISQRSFPEQAVNTSMVRPDFASDMVEARTRVPVKSGEPLVWTTLDVAGFGLFAAHDVAAGTRFSTADFTRAPVPKGAFTPSTVRDEQVPLLQGSVTTRALRRGERLLLNHLEAQ